MSLKKKQQQIALLNKDKEMDQVELKRQRMMILFSVIGLIMFLSFAVFAFSRYRITQRQKDIINKQKVVVEEKQKEIIDSINYAKRIQKALLAGDFLLNQNLPEYFVLYKLKDIVAGDFYWASRTTDGFIYVTGDCTGHGVPGAFMSLLNISKLSETINEKGITRPDLILNNVRKEIIQSLNPEGADDESKDGMDCVLIKLNLSALELEYAAANNSFYIVRKNEVLVCKPDKMPVGKLTDEHESKSFTYNKIKLEKGDYVYTFTDGFADQFGGPDGKKFKYKKLEKLLLDNHMLPAAEQKQRLDEAFENWRNYRQQSGEMVACEQVDDVCVIGVRIV